MEQAGKPITKADRVICAVRIAWILGAGLALILVPLRWVGFVAPLLMTSMTLQIDRPGVRECFGRIALAGFGLAMSFLLWLVWWLRGRRLLGINWFGLEDTAALLLAGLLVSIFFTGGDLRRAD